MKMTINFNEDEIRATKAMEREMRKCKSTYVDAPLNSNIAKESVEESADGLSVNYILDVDSYFATRVIYMMAKHVTTIDKVGNILKETFGLIRSLYSDIEEEFKGICKDCEPKKRSAFTDNGKVFDISGMFGKE